jgi:hypothetical protein
MSENDFFERLRKDARPLRYEPDPVALSRIRARIRATIERPSVAQILAAWFRPVLAAVAAIAAVAVLTLTRLDTTDEVSFGEQTVEITMGGDSYSVGH